jgi:hypothetical protein
MLKLRGVRTFDIHQRSVGVDDSVRDQVAHLEEPEMISLTAINYIKQTSITREDC